MSIDTLTRALVQSCCPASGWHCHIAAGPLEEVVGALLSAWLAINSQIGISANASSCSPARTR
jgi:hypothetical protein